MPELQQEVPRPCWTALDPSQEAVEETTATIVAMHDDQSGARASVTMPDKESLHLVLVATNKTAVAHVEIMMTIIVRDVDLLREKHDFVVVVVKEVMVLRIVPNQCLIQALVRTLVPIRIQTRSLRPKTSENIRKCVAENILQLGLLVLPLSTLLTVSINLSMLVTYDARKSKKARYHPKKQERRKTKLDSRMLQALVSPLSVSKVLLENGRKQKSIETNTTNLKRRGESDTKEE